MKNILACFLSTALVLPSLLLGISLGVIPEKIILKAEKKYDSYVRNRYEAYNQIIQELKGAPTHKKLKEINDFFNNVPFRFDINNWNKKDYWATPLEFLGKDKGDCEDYVIAKYCALRHLGVENEKLFFSYVKSSRFKGGHMVLSYFKTPSSIPLILDSSNFKIFPADKRHDLTPVYNFNGESLFLARKKGQQGKKAKSNKIHKKWDKLLNDVKRNKL